MSIFYVVDKTKLHALVEEEVAKVADEAYAEGGQSLYDSIIVTEKDWPNIDRFMEDALNAFVAREHSISRYAPVKANGDDYYYGTTLTMRLELFVPDFDISRLQAAETQLDRYISLYVCAELFQSRRAEKVPVYTERCKGALESAIALLKTRRVSRTREEPLSGYKVVTEINEDCTDKQLPTAKAVHDLVNSYASGPLIVEGFMRYREASDEYGYPATDRFRCTNGITLAKLKEVFYMGIPVIIRDVRWKKTSILLGFDGDRVYSAVANNIGKLFDWEI